MEERVNDEETAEVRICNDCGETWVDTGDLECPFCGSEDIDVAPDPDDDDGDDDE